MSGRNLTTAVLMAIITLLIGYDFAVAWLAPDGLITDIVWLWAKQYPLVPFLLGLVTGHLLWRAGSQPKKDE
jgi:hypothetical protein